MDAALKQRLIGASVIIALAIIFVPMLFNNDRTPEAKSITIDIPNKPETDLEKQLETKTFEIDSPIVNVPQGEVEVIENEDKEPQLVPIEPNVNQDVANQNVISNNSTVDTTNTTGDIDSSNTTAENETDSPLDTTQDAVTQVENDEPVVETPPVVTTSPDKVDVKPSEVVVEKPAENTAAKQTSGSFRIKLGSFSQKANAEKLKSTLIQNNIRSVISLEAGKNLYRVWSSETYSNKNSAEAYVNSVNKLKLNIGEPKIVDVDAVKVAEIQNTSAPSWVIQMGSFSQKENALDLRNRLRLQSLESFVDEANNANNEKRYRVQIGPFLQKVDAESASKSIQTRLQLNGIVKARDMAPVVN